MALVNGDQAESHLDVPSGLPKQCEECLDINDDPTGHGCPCGLDIGACMTDGEPGWRALGSE